MPNWCCNDLTISGDANPLSDVVARMSLHEGKRTLLFNDFHPLPQEEEENWYDWHCHHWGTKWDLDPRDTNVEIEPTEIKVHCQTAWEPPEAWLRKVAEDFPALTFKLTYDEPGCDFSGELELKDDEVLYERNGRSQMNMEGELESAEEMVLIAPYPFLADLRQDGRFEGEVYAHAYTDEYYNTEPDWEVTITANDTNILLEGTIQDRWAKIYEFLQTPAGQIFRDDRVRGFDLSDDGEIGMVVLDL